MATDKNGNRGHWVTLTTHGSKGEPHRVPVFIKEGTHHVTKGHPKLKGKRVAPERKLPEHWRKEARAAKIDPDHVAQLAAELHGHSKEYAEGINDMLRRARDVAKRDPHRFSSLSNLGHGLRSGDLTKIKGFDLLASQMRDEYPELFGGLHDGQEESHRGIRENAGATSPDERLFGLLQGGNHRPMEHEDAYDKAFRHLYRHGPRHSDDVPFSVSRTAGVALEEKRTHRQACRALAHDRLRKMGYSV